MKDQLKRILNLARKTGNTMIVTDPDGVDAYVVMDLDQYESLLEPKGEKPSETEGFDISDEEIDDFPWVSEKQPLFPEPKSPKPDIWNSMQPAGEQGETWDLSKMSDDEVVDLEKQYQKYAQEAFAAQESASKPEDEKKENPLNLEEKEEDFGEEQFYLEPIE
jgi:hypothetical protein